MGDFAAWLRKPMAEPVPTDKLISIEMPADRWLMVYGWLENIPMDSLGKTAFKLGCLIQQQLGIDNDAEEAEMKRAVQSSGKPGGNYM